MSALSAIRQAAPPAGRTVGVRLLFQSQPTQLYRRDVALLRPGERVAFVYGTALAHLGRVVSVGLKPEPVLLGTSSGTVKAVPGLFRKVLLVRIAGRAARMADGSYQFQGTPIYIGQALELAAGWLRVNGYVVDIGPAARAAGAAPARASAPSRAP